MEIPGSPWRGSLGGPPVTGRRADRQPSVAITVQIQCSYFSGTNLSFFFFGHLGDVFFSNPARIPTVHPGRPTAFRGVYWSASEALGWVFDRWGGTGPVVCCQRVRRAEAAPGQFRWSPRRRGSRNTVSFQSTSTWKHLSGSSLTSRWKPSQANTEAVIRALFDIDHFLYLELRNNTAERWSFLYSFFFKKEQKEIFYFLFCPFTATGAKLCSGRPKNVQKKKERK